MNKPTNLFLLESPERRQRRKWIELANETFDNIQKLMQAKGGPQVVDELLKPDITTMGGGKAAHFPVDYTIQTTANPKAQSTFVFVILKSRQQQQQQQHL